MVHTVPDLVAQARRYPYPTPARGAAERLARLWRACCDADVARATSSDLPIPRIAAAARQP